MKDAIITNKKVGESPFTGIVEDEKDGTMGVIAGKPDFVVHPITKKRIKIVDIWLEKNETKCPGCNKINKNVYIRQLEGGLVVYECPKCEQYHFCKVG